MVLLRRLSTALSAAVAALGSALFIALNYFYRRRTWGPLRARGPYCSITEQEQEEEPRGRCQVLVLGLDGSGKSSLLEALTSGEPASSRGRRRPTRGFNFMSISAPSCQMDLLEIGGGEDLRKFWCEYLRRTHLLVFVVDSSDRRRLLLARAELHRLLGAEPLLPVVILGNKQDKPGAVGVAELREVLSLSTLRNDRKLSLLAVQLEGDGASRDSCWGPDKIQDLLLQLL